MLTYSRASHRFTWQSAPYFQARLPFVKKHSHLQTVCISNELVICCCSCLERREQHNKFVTLVPSLLL